MSLQPDKGRPIWRNPPIPLPRFRRVPIGLTVYFGRWMAWIFSIPLPVLRSSFFGSLRAGLYFF